MMTQFLLSMNQPDSSANVLYDLKTFTRPVFIRYLVPTITGAGTGSTGHGSHLTTSGKDRLSVESDSDSSDDGGGGQSKKRQENPTRWRLPIRRRNGLWKGKENETVSRAMYALCI